MQLKQMKNPPILSMLSSIDVAFSIGAKMWGFFSTCSLIWFEGKHEEKKQPC